jgi:hypothetical protein
MEVVVQAMKVHEHLAGHFTDRGLRHVGEDSIAQFCERASKSDH